MIMMSRENSSYRNSKHDFFLEWPVSTIAYALWAQKQYTYFLKSWYTVYALEEWLTIIGLDKYFQYSVNLYITKSSV